MRKIIVTEFLTLDGVMQGPGANEPGFSRGGWNLPFMEDKAEQYKFDELFAADAQLLGAVTYRSFAAAWPSITDEAGFADRMNTMPKYVVSSDMTEADLTWSSSHLISRNVPEEVQKLKDQPGKAILIAGSGQLVRSLMPHGLIDEYHLMVHPVVLGSGKKLFENGVPQEDLELVEMKSFPLGIVLLSYRILHKQL